jgi:hypothetical protein
MLRAMVGKVRITVIYETSGTEMLQRRSSAGEHGRRKPSLLLCIRNNRKLPMTARSLKCNRVCSGTHANSCIPLLLSRKESLLRNKRKWPNLCFVHSYTQRIPSSMIVRLDSPTRFWIDGPRLQDDRELYSLERLTEPISEPDS